MRTSKSTIIITIIGILFLIGMGFLIKNSTKPIPPTVVADKTLLVKDTSHMLGKPDAKVTVVEFGDYQCPACGAAYPELKKLTDAYKSNPNFTFVFRNFPLSQHKNAPESAEAAEAAGAQGKYWEMHDLLYEHQNDWANADDPTSFFVTYAQTLGLDTDVFKQALATKKYESVIAADQADGNKIGVNHTPDMYINGEEQTDFSFDVLKPKVDAVLAK